MNFQHSCTGSGRFGVQKFLLTSLWVTSIKLYLLEWIGDWMSPVRLEPCSNKKDSEKRRSLTNKRSLLILNFFKNIIQSIEKVKKYTLLQVYFRDNLKAIPEKCSKRIFSSNSLRSPNNTIIKKKQPTKQTKNK